jgi:hypothetical protein
MLGCRTKTEHLKVLELRLDNVDEPVIALRINRRHQETRVEYKRGVVAYDTFDHLVILEGNPDPEAVHRLAIIVEAKVIMLLTFERLDKKDGLDPIDDHVLKRVLGCPRANYLNGNGEPGFEVLLRAPEASVGVALNGLRTEPRSSQARNAPVAGVTQLLAIHAHLWSEIVLLDFVEQRLVTDLQ